MSYYANGNGNVILKHDVDKVVLFEELDRICNNGYCLGYKENENGGLELYDDENYYEDDTLKLLSALSPHIESGEMSYAGKDHSFWKFKFDPNKQTWEKTYGGHYYSEDELMQSLPEEALINELKRRGYTITK